MNRSFLILPAALLLAGCETVSWLQPIHTPSDIVSEDTLPGVWRENGKDLVTIAASGDGYTFTSEDAKGNKTILNGYLLRIDGELYADLAEEGPGIPEHILFRIELDGERMTWFSLNSDWLRARVKDGTLPSIKFAEGKKDTRLVVTIDPAEAQRLFRSYRYEAWDETVALSRVR